MYKELSSLLCPPQALQFDSAVKQRLLSYATSALLFSDCKVVSTWYGRRAALCCFYLLFTHFSLFALQSGEYGNRPGLRRYSTAGACRKS